MLVAILISGRLPNGLQTRLWRVKAQTGPRVWKETQMPKRPTGEPRKINTGLESSDPRFECKVK